MFLSPPAQIGHIGQLLFDIRLFGSQNQLCNKPPSKPTYAKQNFEQANTELLPNVIPYTDIGKCTVLRCSSCLCKATRIKP